MLKLISFLEDRKKIIKKCFFTLFLVFIYVIGTKIFIPLLGEDFYSVLSLKKKSSENDFLFSNNSCSLLALGVIPYVTASIIIQFAQKVFPFFQEWQKQGDKGKYKINIVTRVLTILIAIAQSFLMLQQNPIYLAKLLTIKYEDWIVFHFIVIFFSVVGVFISIWLADLITSKGVGNGISLLIVIGIIDKLFNTFKYLLDYNNPFLYQRLLVLFSFFILLILTIYLSLAYLKLPINYAVDQHNDKIDNHIPFKLNTSGVLPIIIADTFLNITNYIKIFFPKSINFINFFIDSRSYLGIYFFVYLLLVMLFSFFSSFMTINPTEISEHLSKQNAYLKDVRPGLPTVKKLTYEIFKLTCIGSFFLTFLAAAPDVISFCFNNEISRNIKFGGTSLLIVVGVAIETIQNIKKEKNVKNTYSKIF
ncbi:protein translocase [Columbia Basin potato purple top phytoplasma]|uniref:Protein translocase subunit SecY n=2 Tax=Columbia Basin potato purple top phytoplasma TaxID=307134 RepID=A0ABT5L8I7_9MOLU|nr:protein translocase [Columbia Basin potato purple top phytoplasma]